MGPCPGLPHCVSLAGPEVWASPTPTSSASGPAGALQDLTLSQQPSSTWKGTELLTAVPTAPEPSGTDNTATSTSVLPAGERPEDREAVLPAEVEPGFTAREKETTHPPGETTPQPTTHQASTARATTAQGPVTSHPHRDMKPDHHETSAPAGPSQLDSHAPSVEDRGPSATEKAAEDGVSTQLRAGDCSLFYSVFPGTLVPLAWSSGTLNTLCPVSVSCSRQEDRLTRSHLPPASGAEPRAGQTKYET